MANLTASQICALDCDFTDRETVRNLFVMLCQISTNTAAASTATPFTVAHAEALVVVTISSSTILPAYASRTGGYIKNSVTSPGDIFISLGGTPTAPGPNRLAPGETYVLPRGFTGAVNAIRAAGGGTYNAEVIDW